MNALGLPGADEGVKLYLSIGETERLLGVARTTLYRMIDAGHLEAIRTPGGHRRILRSSVQGLRRSMAIAPRGPAPAAAAPAPLPPLDAGAPVPAAWYAPPGVLEPDEAALPEPPAAQAAVEPGPRPLRVLLVDDDQVALSWLRRLVARALPDALVDVAPHTGKAVELLAGQVPPDVVVTDLSMPVDGFRLAWWLHVKPEYRHTLVIALSALAPERVARGGGLPPRVVWMPKPLQPERLIGFLQAAQAAVGRAD